MNPSRCGCNRTVPQRHHSCNQPAIDDRLAWQQPKALISTVLFVVFVWLCVRIWRALIVKSRLSEPERNLKTVGLSFAR